MKSKGGRQRPFQRSGNAARPTDQRRASGSGEKVRPQDPGLEPEWRRNYARSFRSVVASGKRHVLARGWWRDRRGAFSAAISAACAAISAISSSRLGSLGVARIIRLLIQKPIPPSRKIQPPSRSARNQATWAVTISQCFFA